MWWLPTLVTRTMESKPVDTYGYVIHLYMHMIFYGIYQILCQETLPSAQQHIFVLRTRDDGLISRWYSSEFSVRSTVI